MKRGAEKQLTKDDLLDGEGQEDGEQTGFRKADESVLATRKIRGLPKRASVASVPAPAPAEASISTRYCNPLLTALQAPSTKFGGFSGFGATSSSFSGFGTTAAATNNLFAPSGTTQTNTAKTLTSLLSSTRNATTPTFSSGSSTSPSTSASPFSIPPSVPAPSAPIPTSTTTPKDAAASDPRELKYYTSLRGLNESLRAAVGKAVDDDPFADVSAFLERYKSLRADIQRDFDGKTPSSTEPTTTSAAATPSTSAPPVAKTSSMPEPPKGGFSTFAGQSIPSSTSAKPSTAPSGGFTPTFTATSSSSSASPFDVNFKPSSKPSAAPVTTLFGSKSAETTTTTNSSSPFSVKPSESTAPTSNPFSVTSSSKPPTIDFGVKPSTSAPTSLFGFSSNSDSTKTDTKPPANIFGSTSSSTSSFAFNSGSTSSFGLAGAGDKPPVTSPGSGRFAGFVGFGNPATSSSSFGFTPSFIAPPIAPALGSGLAPSPSTLTATASDSSTGPPSAGGGDNTDTAAAAEGDGPKKNIAESFLLNMDNQHDQEGAGEEDEETAHFVKLKAYVMKDEKGAKSWVELGYGVLRIKKHKETGTRRVLLRSSSTGQILINFSFHSAFKPTLKGKNVTFLGHDADGNSKMYTLKLQTTDQATALSSALEREIKAKEASS